MEGLLFFFAAQLFVLQDTVAFVLLFSAQKSGAYC